MKTIILTRGYTTIVDDDDYDNLISFRKWFAISSKNTNGKTVVHAKCKYKNKHISLHRYLTNFPKGMQVDHINGNPLDNRKCNLRVCTKSQNQHNQKIDPDRGSSIYKGVVKLPSGNWQVHIRLNGKNILGGTFKEEKEAGKKYNEMAVKYFGEFASLNEII